MISHDFLNDFSDWTKTTTNLHLLSIVPRWNFNPFICAVPRLEVSPNCSSIAHVSPLKMEIFPPLSWRFVSVVPGNDDQGQSPGGFAPAHSVGQSPKRCVYLCDSMCVYIIYYHPGVDKIWDVQRHSHLIDEFYFCLFQCPTVTTYAFLKHHPEKVDLYETIFK
jgi:hypothetical protein